MNLEQERRSHATGRCDCARSGTIRFHAEARNRRGLAVVELFDPDTSVYGDLPTMEAARNWADTVLADSRVAYVAVREYHRAPGGVWLPGPPVDRIDRGPM